MQANPAILGGAQQAIQDPSHMHACCIRKTAVESAVVINAKWMSVSLLNSTFVLMNNTVCRLKNSL